MDVRLTFLTPTRSGSRVLHDRGNNPFKTGLTTLEQGGNIPEKHNGPQRKTRRGPLQFSVYDIKEAIPLYNKVYCWKIGDDPLSATKKKV